MKAIVYRKYGPPDVLQIEEVEKPVPKDGEVSLEVRAASVNPLDWHFMRGEPFFAQIMMGLGRPKLPRLGVDVAGRVETVGRGVTRLKPGDHVFGPCWGAFAEYACARESDLVTMPPDVTPEEAASVPVAATTALQGLRDKGRIQAGQEILINGAAGGVGTFAVQIARSFGADVTAVCSTRNVDMVTSLGANRVVDYTRDDFTRGERRYDLIFDCIGNHSLAALRRVLKPQGTYLMVGGAGGRWFGPLARMARALLMSRFVSQRLFMFLAKKSQEDLVILRDLMQAGKVTPVVDRRYSLSEVPEAIRYLEEGHARGKVVITVSPAAGPPC
jgi:NADPH:quinone reductase-like Zn-dependent oxidoreductase